MISISWLSNKKDITKNVIAFEGIRNHDDYKREDLKGISPMAIGDGPKWTPKSACHFHVFSLYSFSSSWNIWFDIEEDQCGKYSTT